MGVFRTSQDMLQDNSTLHGTCASYMYIVLVKVELNEIGYSRHNWHDLLTTAALFVVFIVCLYLVYLRAALGYIVGMYCFLFSYF